MEERGYDAVTLLDVDGMKKLLGFPPAMVFMLLNRIYGVQVIPENDILGSATQLMMHFATEETVPYLEYYEFFKDYLLAGVPDFIPESDVYKRQLWGCSVETERGVRQGCSKNMERIL